MKLEKTLQSLRKCKNNFDWYVINSNNMFRQNISFLVLKNLSKNKINSFLNDNQINCNQINLYKNYKNYKKVLSGKGYVSDINYNDKDEFELINIRMFTIKYQDQ